MLCLIRLRILQNALPESALSWKICYIYFLWGTYSDAAPELYLIFYWYVCEYYSGVCIDMFLYVIKYNCWLYFILGTFPCVSPMYGLILHCILIKFTFSLIFLWMLYLCFLWCNSYDMFLGCSTPWEYCQYIFLIYYLLCHFLHPCWPTFTILY